MQDKKESKVINFPLSSSKDNMQNKKCDYKTLAIMTLYSNMTPIEEQDKTGVYERYRFLYRNRIIKFTEEIETLSNNKIKTVLNNIKKISDLENNTLVNAATTKDGKIYYIINYEDDKGRKFVTIPDDMLRYLINVFNSDGIKIYILLKYLCAKGEKRITREYIADQIGLKKSKKVLERISDITHALECCGFIKKRYEYINEVKCFIYYNVNTYEQWHNIRYNNSNKKKRRSV